MSNVEYALPLMCLRLRSRACTESMFNGHERHIKKSNKITWVHNTHY